MAEKIFGALALITSLSISLGGLPAQIWRNYRLGSTQGISPLLIAASLAAYSNWLAYGITRADWFLIFSQAPGVVMSTILVGQHFYYRRRSAKK